MASTTISVPEQRQIDGVRHGVVTLVSGVYVVSAVEIREQARRVVGMYLESGRYGFAVFGTGTATGAWGVRAQSCRVCGNVGTCGRSGGWASLRTGGRDVSTSVPAGVRQDRSRTSNRPGRCLQGHRSERRVRPASWICAAINSSADTWKARC
jgi:hypothetical protein